MIGEPLGAQEIITRFLLLTNDHDVRLGHKLKEQLKEKIRYELEQEERLAAHNNSNNNSSSGNSGSGGSGSTEEGSSTKTTTTRTKHHKVAAANHHHHHHHNNSGVDKRMLGGHVRFGWSMRTGDLQAPVGYDRWSYGIRDQMSSKIHNSQRQDTWAGGTSFGPGDVVGVAICLASKKDDDDFIVSNHHHGHHNHNNHHNSNNNPVNHIRFFKNGQSLGQIMVSRNVRSGGAAFENIEDGTYYPAISIFMGGSVKVNFGPHFVYHIQPNQLSSNVKKLRPMCESCPAPPRAEEVLRMAMKEKDKLCGKLGSSTSSSSSKNHSGDDSNKTDMENILHHFEEIIKTDANIRYEAYENHLKLHMEFIQKERMQRGLSVNFDKDTHK